MGSETYREAVSKLHSTHAKSVEVFLESSIMLPQDATEEAKKAEFRSDSFRLIWRFLELARQHCEEEGLAPGSDEALAAFSEADATAKSIAYAYIGLPYSMNERKALSPDQVTEKLALVVPPNVTDLAIHVKEKGRLRVPQDWLSQAVGDYVRGRFKSPAIDRVLTQALTQVEIAAYMHEMLRKNPLTEMSKLEEARPQSVVMAAWNVSKLVFFVWLLCIGIAASPLAFPALPSDVVILASLGFGVFGTVVLLVILLTDVIGIQREKPRKKMLNTSILEMIDRMNGFFLEFSSAGPISTAHFRKRVNDLADAGVVWPSGLYVLLDDMEARGVRFF